MALPRSALRVEDSTEPRSRNTRVADRSRRHVIASGEAKRTLSVADAHTHCQPTHADRSRYDTDRGRARGSRPMSRARDTSCSPMISVSVETLDTNRRIAEEIRNADRVRVVVRLVVLVRSPRPLRVLRVGTRVSKFVNRSSRIHLTRISSRRGRARRSSQKPGTETHSVRAAHVPSCPSHFGA